jgi:hypothetical protein
MKKMVKNKNTVLLVVISAFESSGDREEEYENKIIIPLEKISKTIEATHRDPVLNDKNSEVRIELNKRRIAILNGFTSFNM